MSWHADSALAVAAAIERGEVGVLTPGHLVPPWDRVAAIATHNGNPPEGGIAAFLNWADRGRCEAAGIDQQWLCEQLTWAAEQLNGAATSEYMARASAHPTDADSPRWSPQSILDGIDLDAPPPTPELLGLTYPQKLTLISGRPETAKTWTALVIGRDAIHRGGVVLVVDTDGTGQRDIASRFLNLGLTRGDLARVAYSDDPRTLFNNDTRPALEAWIADHATRGPVVVVIDSANPTLAALGYRLDEEGVTQLEAAAINPIKRAGGTPIVIDHVAIHADRDSPYSIGTQRKHAAADVHLRLDSLGEPLTRNGPPSAYAIRGMKDRPGGLRRHGKDHHLGRITFTPQPDGAITADITLGPPTPNDSRATFRPTVLMDRVSRWAELQPGPFSKRDAEREVQGKSPAIRAAIDALHAEGYLTTRNGRWTHNRRYREADDPEATT